MRSAQTNPAETSFSDVAIHRQLERIFSDPSFASSEILKRFLSFVVEETLAGRSNTIKEYTIGTQVLNKAINFTPQHDAIVRIHAGRLRRTLNHYYKFVGSSDPVFISIPKGSYVPLFGNTDFIEAEDRDTDTVPVLHPKKNVVVAVVPFCHFENDISRISFANGLGVQLSNELSHVDNYSVIAYYTMSRMSKKILDIRELAPAVGAQYVFTGDIQYQKNNCRINIQLVNTRSNEQVWAQTYETKFSPVNMFSIQDEIIRKVIAMVGKNHLPVAKAHRISMATVA